MGRRFQCTSPSSALAVPSQPQFGLPGRGSSPGTSPQYRVPGARAAGLVWRPRQSVPAQHGIPGIWAWRGWRLDSSLPLPQGGNSGTPRPLQASPIVAGKSRRRLILPAMHWLSRFQGGGHYGTGILELRSGELYPNGSWPFVAIAGIRPGLIELGISQRRRGSFA